MIGADGSLTGFGGGLDGKRWLLEHEGGLGLRLLSSTVRLTAPGPGRNLCSMPFHPLHFSAAALALGVSLSACETSPGSAAGADSLAAGTTTVATTAPPELIARADSMMRAWNGEDPAAVARFFADDAMAMTPDSSYSGADEIREQWVSSVLPVLSDLAVTDREFSGGGETMTETGSYRYVRTADDQPPTANIGTYSTTWEWENEGWKVTSMRVLGDSTAAAPATPKP